MGLGAFGAHGLESVIGDDPARLGWWKTAVLYHLIHAVAIAAIPLVPGRASKIASAAFGLGVLGFSGTLYAMALGAPRWFGAITPIGGLLLIVGWLAIFASAWHRE